MSFNLKSSIFKPLFLFLIIAQTLVNLEAKEPTIAILKSISSNDTQRFQINSNSFICEPYGVVSLEKIYAKSKKDSLCRKSIDEFYVKNRKLLYFSQSFLKLFQGYHIELKNLECVVYAKGQTTLSELLLSEGLAVNKNGFKDREFSSVYEKVSRTAKRDKKGVWNSSVLKDCASLIVNN